jgi:CAAX prenyl protease-like protein
MLYLVPFFTFMLAGALEPSPDKVGGEAIGLSIPYSAYPWVYAVKIALTLAAVAFVWPGYRAFPFRLSPLAAVLGIVGGPLWIGIALLEHAHVHPLLEQMGAGGLVGAGARAAFNPFEQLPDQPAAAWAFLAARFFGLAAVVPLIEEFFLRGFVMRFFMDREWWNIPFGKTDRLALILGTAVPMLMHPGELVAAFVWFSMITWLMLRTRNIWDCVLAHALTNLILGIYVVTTNTWRLM